MARADDREITLVVMVRISVVGQDVPGQVCTAPAGAVSSAASGPSFIPVRLIDSTAVAVAPNGSLIVY